MNPFTVLGLPTSPEVTDAQVRAAWRAIGAATHPDRPDGGNPARYTAATTAYAQLRTAWGRSEADADLAAGEPHAPAPATPTASPGAELVRAARLIPARIRHGRPGICCPRPRRRAHIAAGGGPTAGTAIRPRRRDGPGHLVHLHRARGPGPAPRPVKRGVLGARRVIF